MKKVILMAVVVLIAFTVNSCRKETEKIIERVEVQKGNQILSGIGAPVENLGNVGDYYLDLSNTNLYGAKTAQGWGTPISLKGIQGDKGDTGATGEKGDKGDKGDTQNSGQKGDKGDKGEKGDKGDKGDAGQKGDKGDAGQKGDKGQKGDTGAKGEKGEKGDKGEQGVTGQDGSKIFAGTGAPTNIGKAGDWYIDTLNKRLYGPKTNSGWSTSYINLGSSLTPSTPIRKSDYELSPDKKTLVKWNYKKITHIDMNSNKELKEVKVIAKKAFYGCENLISVSLPNTLVTIEDYAFWGCSSLRDINLPNGLTTIGNKTFVGCNDLESVTIPNSVTYIGSAFSASGITSIVIPNGITEVNFNDCKFLKSVTLPNTITKINFLNCASLISVTIPKGVEEIQTNTFKGCSELETIIVGDNVTHIKTHAFPSLEKLKKVIIKGKIREIEAGAFAGSMRLKTIIIESETIPFTNIGNVFNGSEWFMYVPKKSVKAYRDSFQGYSDRIKAIEDLEN